MGLPRPMVDYIMNMYNRSYTRICCGGWKSEAIRPNCGVKQGDPMSPVIFNMIIDDMLKRLPDDIGTRVGDLVVNAIAFADDIILFASTPRGLQSLLDRATEYLASCGLHVNVSKCMTVAISNVLHKKRSVIDKDTIFMCQGRVLPALKRTNKWKYLGIPFTPEGRAYVKIIPRLEDAIAKLTKAALKPQQRLFALRTVVIPSLYHQLELGNTSISLLRKCNNILRTAVRKWLNLPTDFPNAYIHANIRDEGLGITSLRWSAPLRRLKRLESLPLTQQQASDVPGSFLNNEIQACRRRLLNNGVRLFSSEEVSNRWA